MRQAAQSFSPFFVKCGDIRLRAARFDAPAPRKICALLTGQTEFIEKYFEVIDELRQRGFSVAILDWRGQGGSDRLTADTRKAHIQDFRQYDQDLEAFMGQVVGPMVADLPSAGRPVAVAHSMGGHILLRRLHDKPDEFAAIVLTAPMIAIQPRGVPWWVVALLARLLGHGPPSKNFVWGMGGRDQLKLPFALQIVTSDPDRYRRTQELLAANPDLRLNGPTWGWLAAALKSMMALHAPGFAEAITTPCLFLGAGHDRVCNNDALCAFAARVPHAECITIEGAGHEILMERDVYRERWWREFDRFMTHTIG